MTSVSVPASYDDWKTTPPPTREWTEDDDAEFAAMCAADYVLERLEGEAERRKAALLALYKQEYWV